MVCHVTGSLRARREVLSLAVPLLADLPAATTLVFHVTLHDGVRDDDPRDLVLTTSRAAYEAAAARGELVLSPVEYEVLAEALADGRLTTRGALKELSRKARALRGMERRRASAAPYRIERERLMGGVMRPSVPPGGPWTFGELAVALGAELVQVDVVDMEVGANAA